MRLKNMMPWLIMIVVLALIGLILAIPSNGKGAVKEPSFAMVYCMDGSTYIGKVTDYARRNDDAWIMITLEDDLTFWTHTNNVTLMSEAPDYVTNNSKEMWIGKER